MLDSQSWLNGNAGTGVDLPLLFDAATNPKPAFFEALARLQFFVKFKGEIEPCSAATDPTCDPNNPVDVCGFEAASLGSFGAALPTVNMDWAAPVPFTISGTGFATKKDACVAACEDQLVACKDNVIAQDKSECTTQHTACAAVAKA